MKRGERTYFNDLRSLLSKQLVHVRRRSRIIRRRQSTGERKGIFTFTFPFAFMISQPQPSYIEVVPISVSVSVVMVERVKYGFVV